ncbi:hypothetical protein LIPSTDRAFT_243877 [Lipomyces starkeyi NRRL Y-11557]|uniref:Uncharacterized protein n=1 Tax=Lipomyces starkeyi NRRL Y-11557 TaxID=675824 RepID=A0A1E3QA64_LIPST|nr:hypothetical protein LIPSTDRAFT_243877 [Lipomyces starkeyi NRRL Y-11557]
MVCSFFVIRSHYPMYLIYSRVFQARIHVWHSASSQPVQSAFRCGYCWFQTWSHLLHVHDWRCRRVAFSGPACDTWGRRVGMSIGCCAHVLLGDLIPKVLWHIDGPLQLHVLCRLYHSFGSYS